MAYRSPAPADATHEAFYTARIAELEEENTALRVACESSAGREEALHRSIEGYKALAAELRTKRDALVEECDARAKTVSVMTDKVSALLTENEALRAQIRRLDASAQAASAQFAQLAEAAAAPQQVKQLAGTGGDEEADVEELRERLRLRTAALNDAYNVIAQLNVRAPSVSTADHSTWQVARRHTGHSGAASALLAPPESKFLARQNAELSVQVATLQRELALARR